MATFGRPKPGEWVQPRKYGYKMMCCDCGLVHKMDFRHVVKAGNHAIMSKGGKVQFRCWRDTKSTGAARAAMTKRRKDELSQTPS